ncbi:MAG: hypothetical protein ABEH59_01235 [Halobacteriales archaeon]
MERRNAIRLLIGLAIGIPVAVEATTFFGLLGTQLFGGDEPPAPTATLDRVGVGEELLPATAPTETVREATIQGDDTPWLFVLGVEIDNSLDVPYELQLGTLTLVNGETVGGAASSGRIPAGESGEVTGAWELPADTTPETLTVTGRAYEDSEVSETTADVALAKVPVRGG